MNQQPDMSSVPLKTEHVVLMAIGTGGIVANIYYIQPLLSLIASHFAISATSAGTVAMLSQLGTALGMFFFVPLGDTKERRGLIVKLLLAACICLVAMATARNLWWLATASFGIGLTAATVHVIVPYAAHLAPKARRGSVIGTVMSGLLLGILLARTVSGLLGAWFGWRLPYLLSALLMLVIAALYRSRLPRSEPSSTLSWPQLIRSTGTLIRTQPVLVESSLVGASFFGAFSAFWTTLVFFLQRPPYHYGSAVAGLFGLVGAVGAAGAPLIGRRADRRGARGNITFALLIVLVAFVVLWMLRRSHGGSDHRSDPSRLRSPGRSRLQSDANLRSPSRSEKPIEHGLYDLLFLRGRDRLVRRDRLLAASRLERRVRVRCRHDSLRRSHPHVVGAVPSGQS